MDAGPVWGRRLFLGEAMNTDLQTLASPCSGVCQLDTAGLCLGCRRSGAEIAGWRQMDAAERRRFMHDILPARGWVPVLAGARSGE